MKNYCLNCDKERHFDVKIENKTAQINGIKINYKGKIAYCKTCKESVLFDDLIDYNISEAHKAYRKKIGIISLEEILYIMEKYNIKKRPLSKLLGWGEITFSRYCEGYIPSKQYSDILKEILYNESSYLNRLNSNKDKISKLAYKKTISAVNSIIQNKTNFTLKSRNKYKTKVEGYINITSQCNNSSISLNALISAA